MYDVEEIKRQGKDDRGRPIYCVSWKGYGDDQDTWEYAGNISREAMRAYRMRTDATQPRPRRRSSVRSR